MTIHMLVLKYFMPKTTKFNYLDFFKVSVIFKVKMETLEYTQIFFFVIGETFGIRPLLGFKIFIPTFTSSVVL